MSVNSVDASNSCIPPSHPLVRQSLPLPTTVRGEPLSLDGDAGRLTCSDDRRLPLVAYGFGKLVVIREFGLDELLVSVGGGIRGGGNNDDDDRPSFVGPAGGSTPSTGGFVYRGHSAAVSCVKFSPSGSYVASGDVRGRLRIWSYDHDEHLPRLDVQALAGPIRDVCWDHESKRVAVCGDGGMTSAECSRIVMWDTGVKCGDLQAHGRRRGSTVAIRPCRPMRIATGGAEDATVYFHSGPPFRRVVAGGDDGVVAADERCHARGAVHRVRYSPDGSSLASVGTDGSVCFYDGKTMELRRKVERAHGDSSVYSCAWDRDGSTLLTCGADGFARLYDGMTGREVREWDLKSPSLRGGAAGPGPGPGVPAGSMQLGCAFVKGNVPVSVGHDGQIAILPLDDDADAASSSPISVVTGHRAPISAMALVVGAGPRGEEGRAVYTADTDGVVVEWDGRSGRARGRVVSAADDDVGGGSGVGGGCADNGNAVAVAAGGIHAGATVTSLVFVPDDDYDDDYDYDEAGGGGGTLYSAGWDDCIRTTRGRTCDGRLRMESQPNAMCVGTRVVVVMTVGGICLVGRTGRERRAASSFSFSGGLTRLPYVPTSVCLSRDDATLYVGGDDRNIHVYALSPGHVDFGGSAASSSSSSSSSAADDPPPPPPPLDETHVIEGGHLHPVQSMALSPDGTMLAAADVRDVCVYSTSCGYPAIVPRGRWCFHSQRIGCLAWSPDGTVIASGGADDSIFLWCPNAKTRRVQYRFAHRGGITGLGFVGGGGGGGAGPSSSAIVREGGGDWMLVSAGADGCLNWWTVEKDVREKFGV